MIIKAVCEKEVKEGSTRHIKDMFFEAQSILEVSYGKVEENFSFSRLGSDLDPAEEKDGPIISDMIIDARMNGKGVRVWFRNVDGSLSDIVFGELVTVYIMDNGKTVDRYGY